MTKQRKCEMFGASTLSTDENSMQPLRPSQSMLGTLQVKKREHEMGDFVRHETPSPSDRKGKIARQTFEHIAQQHGESHPLSLATTDSFPDRSRSYHVRGEEQMRNWIEGMLNSDSETQSSDWRQYVSAESAINNMETLTYCHPIPTWCGWLHLTALLPVTESVTKLQ